MDDLEKQIEREAAEIENAPRVKVETGHAGRCSFCGRISKHLEFVETTHGIDRYKGECCRV